MSTEQGIDVSKWQGRVDFDEARHQIGFAMVKATQGVDEVDADYAHDMHELRELGELRGSYHYPNAGDPEAEAHFYVEHAVRRNGEMQALDFEGAVLDLDDPVGWAYFWLRQVRALTGNTPLIYMSGSTCNRFDWRRVVELGAGLWVASWGSEKPYDVGAWPFAIMWQRDETGHVHGVNGDVDQDVFYGDAGTWARYAHNAGTIDGAPHPVPGQHRAPEPHPGPSAGAEYVVRGGDTLSRIAHEYGTSVDHLVELNRERHPSLTWNRNLIQVGWKLLIP